MSESTIGHENRVPGEFFEFDPGATGSKGIILFANGKALFYRRDNKDTIPHPNAVDLIGGHVDDGETPFDTLKREAMEEAFLNITEEMMVYACRWPSTMYPGKFAWFVAAQTPYSIEDVKWGDEGQGPIEMTLNEFFEIEDAWPGFQYKAREYLRPAGEKHQVNVEVGDSPIQGKGLFTTEFIPMGGKIVCPPPKSISKQRFVTSEELEVITQQLLSEGKHWDSYSNGDGTHTISTAPRENDPSNFGNHSCDPNNDRNGVALRDIEAGEEITVDYAQFSDKSWSMPCNCGSENCTGIVRGAV